MTGRNGRNTLQENYIWDKEELIKFSTARYHENTYDIDLFVGKHGVTFVDADLPYVIYQSKADYGIDKVWAREVDDFFGYKVDNGQYVKRFSSKET